MELNSLWSPTQVLFAIQQCFTCCLLLIPASLCAVSDRACNYALFWLKGCDNCSDDLYLRVLGLCLSETWAESNVQE